jgi:hypothetical protein
MSAVQVHAALGRGRGHRHVHGRDDRVRACGGGFLGGVVRALSDDLARARRPRQTSRGASEGREGRRRREPRIGYQVWRTVDPVARGDSGRERSRPGCRRAASRCFGAAIGASARRVNSPSELGRAVVRPWPAVLKESEQRRVDPPGRIRGNASAPAATSRRMLAGECINRSRGGLSPSRGPGAASPRKRESTLDQPSPRIDGHTRLLRPVLRPVKAARKVSP